jgi:hypothetical protein
MKRRIFFIAMVWLVCANLSFSEDVSSLRFVDKKVAGLIVGKDGIEKVIKLYGRGVLRETFRGEMGTKHVEILYYYDADEQTYFIVYVHDGLIVTITLTKELTDKKLNQSDKRAAKIKTLSTGRGVRLGDSPNKVTRVYGGPHRKGTRDGMLVFEYHTDYTKDPRVRLFYDAYFYFSENGLVELVIHGGQ